VGEELKKVENDIEGFKRNNQIADLSEQAKTLISNATEVQKSLAVQDVQIKSYSGFWKVILPMIKNNERVMPTTAPIQDPAFVSLEEKYNSLQLQKQQMLLNSTEKNPAIQTIDVQLAQQRADLLKILRSFKKRSYPK